MLWPFNAIALRHYRQKFIIVHEFRLLEDRQVRNLSVASMLVLFVWLVHLSFEFVTTRQSPRHYMILSRTQPQRIVDKKD